MSTTLNKYQLSCELVGHSLDVRAVSAGAHMNKNEGGGQTIISGSRDKTVKIWKPFDNAFMESVTFQDHKNFVAAVCFLAKEQWIVTASNDATICIYKIDSYVPILTLKGHNSTVCAVSAGVEACSLISGSWDQTARVWNIDEQGIANSIVLRGHEAAVWAVVCFPTTRQYVTGSADKCIYYWNDKGEKLRLLKGHTDCVRGLLAMPDETLISCANDATIRHWSKEGECIRELVGHTNYIYNLALLKENVLVSCGEDSTLRMWDLTSGEELGEPLVHPAQSVWSVACLENGDIVTGSSDAIVRVFTQAIERVASKNEQEAYRVAVSARVSQMNEELGGIKKTDLPGPESLLVEGTREGQTKMVRHADGKVKCYMWQEGNWTLIGDVTGGSGGTQANSGKTLYEGKEYDYVFSVDVSDTQPAIKLPYNKGEDPWTAAQSFIHRNNLPQAYLDQVANFIITNANNAAATTVNSASTGFQDPFTGGSRYVPGSNSNSSFQSVGNADPFTGASSYSTQKANSNITDGAQKHFPVSTYLTFDKCDPLKVLEKLREFNNKQSDAELKVSDNFLEAFIRLADPQAKFTVTVLQSLTALLRWPADTLFPVLDILRLAVRHEKVFDNLFALEFFEILLPNLNASAANQLMVLRGLANMMVHAKGREQVDAHLAPIVERINNIKSGTANLQIAIATFYLNVTIAQTLGVANVDYCRIVTEGVIEFMKWATDLEASYRIFQTIGNLTTTPFGQETTALIISADFVIDRIRELTNTPQTGAFAKINAAGSALLATF